MRRSGGDGVDGLLLRLLSGGSLLKKPSHSKAKKQDFARWPRHASNESTLLSIFQKKLSGVSTEK